MGGIPIATASAMDSGIAITPTASRLRITSARGITGRMTLEGGR